MSIDGQMLGMGCVPPRLGWFVVVSSLVILQSRDALALPSQRCETLQIIDRDGIGLQMGLPKLAEMVKTVPLSVVPDNTPADIRIEFAFFSASGRINAAIRSWAESEPANLQSELVQWSEDFTARKRIIRPMKEPDAQAFHQQIVKTLADLVAARAAAVAIGSEPEGLAVAITNPPGAAAPINRNRTVALLGCLQEGTELSGVVTWPDGHREEFRQRANLTPGRFVVGTRAATENPQASAAPTQPDAADDTSNVDAPNKPNKPSASIEWRWWVGGLLAFAVGVAGWLVGRRRNQLGR